LVNELRLAGIRSREGANAYLHDTFLPQYNATFARVPRDPASAFVPLGHVDLETILCHEEERVVARDNTVVLAHRVLQIAPQAGRRSCAGLTVLVRHHLDGRYSIMRGAQPLGHFRSDGTPMEAAGAVDAKHAPTAPWKTQKARFPQLPQASV
jgi:hypothetical protein